MQCLETKRTTKVNRIDVSQIENENKNWIRFNTPFAIEVSEIVNFFPLRADLWWFFFNLSFRAHHTTWIRRWTLAMKWERREERETKGKNAINLEHSFFFFREWGFTIHKHTYTMKSIPIAISYALHIFRLDFSFWPAANYIRSLKNDGTYI